MSKTLSINGGRQLSGRAVAPPDKSIFHRALILSALAKGECTIAPLSFGQDNLSTARALSDLGVDLTVDKANGIVRVSGVGSAAGMSKRAEPIDCGNSGTTMRLLSGVLAATDFTTVLTGDDSLSARPMSRLLPLERMGARISGRKVGDKIFPPLVIHGAGRDLRGADHDLEVASAQVKSALLLAGLWARGTTRVREPGRSRDHTERMLKALGASIVTKEDWIELSPLAQPWSGRGFEVAPDLSSAAFLIAAAMATKSPDVAVKTGVNPTRAGCLDVFSALGADVRLEERTQADGEPVAWVRVGSSDLVHTHVSGALTLRSIDEIPLIAAMAALAEGTTVIEDAQELRVKESDRLRETSKLLAAFGASSEETESGIIVHGSPGRLHPAEVDASVDHRIAMTACVLALAVRGCTRVHGAEIIDVSYPGFARVLADLGADVTESGAKLSH